VSWETTSSILDKADVPGNFQTNSATAIIANSWRSSNNDVKALEDRGQLFVFRPSAEEVHREISDAGWFRDTTVLRFIESRLDLIARPSFRLYVSAAELHAAADNGMDIDWRAMRAEELSAIAELWTSGKTAGDVQREFTHRFGCSRAHYFRRRRELLGENPRRRTGGKHVRNKTRQGPQRATPKKRSRK
jgi:hypothetical protein